MEKKKKELVGGVFRPDTGTAFLYEQLQDQKPHRVKDLVSLVGKKYGVDVKVRLSVIRVQGKKHKSWALTFDEDAGTVRLIKGAKAAAASTAGKKKAAPTPTAGKRKALPKGPASDEQHEQAAKNGTGSLGATLTLIRRLLKDDKDWTRNKLIEGMKKQFHIAPKLAEAGIEAGLKNGNLKEQEDGQVVAA